ncbi:uncharacterized protein LOC143249230 isoform X1 [Tachypleus tridentatus]|uniref:uncharacterized protein LOC143248647 n=1 Tax=Tachypleus tridentatus TaxID=6853 RepID=UPI003FD133E4
MIQICGLILTWMVRVYHFSVQTLIGMKMCLTLRAYGKLSCWRKTMLFAVELLVTTIVQHFVGKLVYCGGGCYHCTAFCGIHHASYCFHSLQPVCCDHHVLCSIIIILVII